MKLPGHELLPARGGVNFPLSKEEMRWHLSYFDIRGLRRQSGRSRRYGRCVPLLPRGGRAGKAGLGKAALARNRAGP